MESKRRGRKCAKLQEPLSPSPLPEISDDELVSLSVHDLNVKLKTFGLDKDGIARMKRRRRLIKNRGYAVNCRSKRSEEVDFLETERWFELDELETMADDNEKIRDEISDLKNEYDMLVQFAKQNDIPVPKEFDEC